MPRRSTYVLALAPVVLLAAAVGAVSCFNPKLGDGGFPCGPGGECPSGYRCAVALGDCYKEGAAVPDAGMPDAQQGRVEVVVLDDNLGVREPAAGRPVVFQGPTGQILATVMTDTQGLAAFDDMVIGGMVTSGIGADGLSAGLETVVGVAPGDHIVMQGRFDRSQTQPPLVSMISVNIPMEFAGATSYRIDIGCAETTGTVVGGEVQATLEARRECIHVDNGVQKINVVAHALSNTPSPDTPIAYTVSANHPINVGGTTVVNMMTWTVDWLQLELRVANPPMPQPPGTMHGLELRPQADLSPRDFRVFPTGQFEFPGGSNPAPFIFKVPRAIYDTLNVQVQAVLNAPTRYTHVYIQNFVVPFPTQPVTIDLDMPAPGPTRVAMVNPGAAGWGLEWEFTDAPMPRPGAFLFLAGVWLEPGPGGVDAGGSDSNQRFWIVLAPQALPSPFTFPELPSSLDGFRPSPMADFSPPPIGILGKIDIFDDYKDVRNELGPGVIASDNLLPNRAFVLRATGLIPTN